MTNECRICRCQKVSTAFKAREMMFGLRDEFKYFECSDCGCLQIEELPRNLSKYYPSDYMCFQEPSGGMPIPQGTGLIARLKAALRCQMITHQLGHSVPIGSFLCRLFHRHYLPAWMTGYPLRLRLDSRILEVGAGGGEQLILLVRAGFTNLSGIDPYIPKESISLGRGTTIRRANLNDIEGKFDMIMFHHSLEHVEDPDSILAAARARLHRNGWIIIRVPVAGSFACRKYGADWVQLDPPRHLHIYSPKSLKILADRNDLDLVATKYDSTGLQFWGSELYRRDIPLLDDQSPLVNTKQRLFSAMDMQFFESTASELNAKQEGDQAIFYLRYRE